MEQEGQEVPKTQSANSQDTGPDEYAELIRILKTDAEDFNPES